MVINPMLGGRFQMADGSTPVPAPRCSPSGSKESRRCGTSTSATWADLLGERSETEVLDGRSLAGADSVPEMGFDGVSAKRLRRFRDELKDLLRNQGVLGRNCNA